MIQHQYKWQSITEEINLEESHASDAFSYTKALAASLQDTRNALLRKLLDDAPLFTEKLVKHEIEVNFDE